MSQRVETKFLVNYLVCEVINNNPNRLHKIDMDDVVEVIANLGDRLTIHETLMDCECVGDVLDVLRKVQNNPIQILDGAYRLDKRVPTNVIELELLAMYVWLTQMKWGEQLSQSEMENYDNYIFDLAVYDATHHIKYFRDNFPNGMDVLISNIFTTGSIAQHDKFWSAVTKMKKAQFK